MRVREFVINKAIYTFLNHKRRTRLLPLPGVLPLSYTIMPPKRKREKDEERDVKVEVQGRNLPPPLVLFKRDTGYFETTVVARPSKMVKSPYLADIKVPLEHCADFDDDVVIAHSPALGAMGMIAAGSTVFVTPKKDRGPDVKSKYSVDLVKITEKGHSYIVGVNPNPANAMVKTLLQKWSGEEEVHKDSDEVMMVHDALQGIEDVKHEVKVRSSRLDLVGTRKSTGRPVFIEVKGVPIADYEEMDEKEKKAAEKEDKFSDRAYDSKVAVFPLGYRKKKTDAISPRAVKHVELLTDLVKEEEGESILVFIVQRPDVARFQTSRFDPAYTKAVKAAIEAGVHVVAVQVEWRGDEAHFIRMLDVKIPQEE